MTSVTVTVTKPDGSQESLSDDTLNELNTQLRGQLVTSTDPEAAEEPTETWNAMYQDRAALTARCSGTADVVDAVRAAGGPQLDRRAVSLPTQIKTVGRHSASVRLHPEVNAELALEVTARG